jgi:hypothetical protein
MRSPGLRGSRKNGPGDGQQNDEPGAADPGKFGEIVCREEFAKAAL